MTEDPTRVQDEETAVSWWLRQEQPQPQDALPITAETVLGRGQNCDVILPSGRASRRHAKLELVDDQLFIEDLGSANGTLVNGEKIERVELANGDSIGIDEIVFTIDGPEPDPHELNTIIETPAPAPAPPPSSTPADVDADADADAPGRQWWDRADEGPEGTVLNEKLPPHERASDGTVIVQGVAAEADGPSLVCVSQPYVGQIFKLDPDGTVIGRDSSCDVRLEDNAVSVRHARITRDDGAWKLVDLMSANGTFVQGKKVQTAFLSAGNRIELGRIELRFVENSDEGTRFIKQLKLEQPAEPVGGRKTLPAWVLVLAGFVAVLAAGAAYLLLLR